jgi:DnaJ-domain-containing protein 1
MTEHRADAIAAALAMLRDPRLARLAQRGPLPRGVTLVLEVAAGEGTALSRAHSMTNRSEATLQKAAGFFIEQVLLNRQSDNYRVLGSSPEATAAELRRHMALLLKWLHPDLLHSSGEDKGFNRSAYVSLVTNAWETLKTAGRRASYDASLASRRRERKPEPHRAWHEGNGRPPGAQAAGVRMAQGRIRRRRAVYRLRGDGLLTRLLSYFGRH